jgi:hypothetical protein
MHVALNNFVFKFPTILCVHLFCSFNQTSLKVPSTCPFLTPFFLHSTNVDQISIKIPQFSTFNHQILLEIQRTFLNSSFSYSTNQLLLSQTPILQPKGSRFCMQFNVYFGNGMTVFLPHEMLTLGPLFWVPTGAL